LESIYAEKYINGVVDRDLISSKIVLKKMIIVEFNAATRVQDMNHNIVWLKC